MMLQFMSFSPAWLCSWQMEAGLEEFSVCWWEPLTQRFSEHPRHSYHQWAHIHQTWQKQSEKARKLQSFCHMFIYAYIMWYSFSFFRISSWKLIAVLGLDLQLETSVKFKTIFSKAFWTQTWLGLEWAGLDLS